MTSEPRLPTRLAAAPPGWEQRADVVVVGSGIAGLTAALEARRAGRVLLVTKSDLAHGATRWAQGGIAAALSPLDSAEEHLRDTLVAGVGLCDLAAVRTLVTEGPERVRALMSLGAVFDTAGGDLSFTREGGHLRSRVIHAGGDATGAEVERALLAAVSAAPEIDVIEHALVLDLLRGPAGQAAGITLHVLGEGSPDGVGAVTARAVVLATGGMGQVFAATTNPTVSTGDGVALALRAGAVVTDLEFVQFHPTALHAPGTADGSPLPLISEAMRGEGAVIVDGAGRRLMEGVHPLADLAPRDVVAKAMSRRIAVLGTDHLYLDARPLGAETLLARFPTIVARCRDAGIDPVTEPIPVAPAAHYASGGVRTDLHGRASIPGLYACGEVACTGVHGANRLASNSLLEGLVFAHRIGESLAADLPPYAEPVAADGVTGLVDPEQRAELAGAMTEGAGVLRSAETLGAATKTLEVVGDRTAGEPETASWEMTNLHAVATVLVAAASRREETRGSHWREDFPDPMDAWLGHLCSRVDPDGTLETVFAPLPATAQGVTLPSELVDRLTGAGLDPAEVQQLARRALAEDLAGGVDVTSVATVPLTLEGTLDLVARGSGVVAGLPVAAAVFAVAADGGLDTEEVVQDGARVGPGERLLSASGLSRTLLTAERTALNLLCHLSGIATLTRAWVDAVAGTGAVLRDTRKTTPGLRALEKYAVRCGGGANHRLSLAESALVKDNHVVAAGGVAAALSAVRSAFPNITVQVECDTVEQVAAAVEAGAELVLCDNMGLADLHESVRVAAGRARVEASGGLTLATARQVAETGIDFLAVGALTHSAPVLDIAADLRAASPGEGG